MFASVKIFLISNNSIVKFLLIAFSLKKERT